MEQQYLDLAQKVLEQGELRDDRTGTGTLSLFAEQMKFDLSCGKFPLWTTREINWKGVIGELLWFISGSTNAKELEQNYGVKFWNAWADEDGSLGRLYGYQFRTLKGNDGKIHDQLLNAVNEIKTNGSSRRIIISTWNVGDIEHMNLPPCHGNMIQFYVRRGKYLDMQMYQRSADLFLGISSNVPSYSLLLEMMASVCGLQAGVFTHTLGDVHIYSNHIDQMKEQVQRRVLPLPNIVVNPKIDCITKFTVDDIKLMNYTPQSKISGKVSV